jgi:hypothetical protein
LQGGTIEAVRQRLLDGEPTDRGSRLRRYSGPLREPEEDEQALWLEHVMAEARERRIAWFLHRPLFLEDPSEGDSGHLRKARDFAFEGTRYIWSPASSFLVGATQPEMPGEKRLGAVVYELDNATSTARIAEVPGLTQDWVDM